jgi:hypothetical protein
MKVIEPFLDEFSGRAERLFCQAFVVIMHGYYLIDVEVYGPVERLARY